MAIKESLEENKQIILDSLPTEELKQEFLAGLDKVEEPAAPSVEEQVAEAQAPDHVSEELYEAVKKEITSFTPPPPMSADEEKAAIEEGLKQVPTESNED
ncbi:hypothetical protein [Roseivirga sp. E12]|uniref:hypothetical protein n=1 Tax=Roseivirga sp. E12 TaxID=2819237 RepID=UPI001ABCAC8C|nr:hypothetical protein [Roseivirga sp. E12]MBO3698054.1 hypothetical protein [Roseivirga sp. E12]